MKQRLVLWGALAALVAGAAGLVVVGGGGDGGEDAPALPLSVGSGAGATEARAASLGALELVARTTYVAAGGLPARGGTGPAYRLPESVDAGAVRELALALGIEGEPGEQAGAWQAAGGGMALHVYGPTGSWTAYSEVASDSTASPVAPAAPATTSAPAPGTAPAGEPDRCVERDGGVECVVRSGGSASASASASAATGCPTEPADPCPEQPAPGPPADLPSEDEARRIALDLLAAAGTDVEDADVRVDDRGGRWAVAVEPRLGGLPAPGLAARVAVGPGGRIDSASGYLGPPEELGDYDLLDTRAALDRLNDDSWGYRTMGPADGPVTESFTASASRPPSPPVTPETTVPPGSGGGDVPVPSASPPTTVASGAGPGGDGATGSDGASGDGSTGSGGSGEDTSGGVASGGVASGDGGQPRTLPAPADGAPPTTPTVAPTTTPGDGTGQIAPGEPSPRPPAPEPEPVEVAVTDAEVVLVAVPSWDDTGTYLVPGYRFAADDGSGPTVPAITDEVLAPPPDGGPGEPEEAEPAPLPAPAPVEPEARPVPNPTAVEPDQPAPAGG